MKVSSLFGLKDWLLNPEIVDPSSFFETIVIEVDDDPSLTAKNLLFLNGFYHYPEFPSRVREIELKFLYFEDILAGRGPEVIYSLLLGIESMFLEYIYYI